MLLFSLFSLYNALSLLSNNNLFVISSLQGVMEENVSSLSRFLQSVPDKEAVDFFARWNLNDSQLNAVLDCASSTEKPTSSLKLIWGPPGTGKTKTISMLLIAMLIKNCRTVTCAPTNTAVVEVASRLLRLVEDSFDHFQSDIVLFGNKDRMRVDEGLSKIFLEDRVVRLLECFMPNTGIQHRISSMIGIFKNCDLQYQFYLDKQKLNNQKDSHEECCEVMGDNCGEVMSLVEYIKTRFNSLARDLKYVIEIFFDDFPRALISQKALRRMHDTLDLLPIMEELLQHGSIADRILEMQLKIEVRSTPAISSLGDLTKVMIARSDIRFFHLVIARDLFLKTLRSLSRHLTIPDKFERRSVEELVLQHAKSILCTACSSFKLHSVKMHTGPLEVLVVDEAAQLKESESLIPLLLPGIKNVVLIGDEFQLPAMVKSMVYMCCLLKH